MVLLVKIDNTAAWLALVSDNNIDVDCAAHKSFYPSLAEPVPKLHTWEIMIFQKIQAWRYFGCFVCCAF
jgi:hypothetical protein